MTNRSAITSVDKFMEALANPSLQPETGKLFENMYADKDSVQNKNLTLYLNTMLNSKPKPTILLLGEAPGYRGCGKTGIPFTDEFHLYEQPSHSGYGERIGAGIKYSELHDAQLIEREIETSATIIWDALDEWATPPLMWNAFPFHPYKGSNNKTNRTPIAKEIALGREYLDCLSDIFDISKENIYCVGRTAQRALEASDACYIRHPSYGGKEQCTKQLKASSQR